MKRICYVGAVLFCSMFCANTYAQSLGSILKQVTSSETVSSTISKVVSEYTGTTVSLPGTWSYTGPAIELESSSSGVLSTVTSSAASSAAEEKIAGYIEKIGLTEGSVTFTFSSDSTFTCAIFGKSLSGTWSTADSGEKLTLKFGKNMKLLSMTGSLKSTTAGCEMLFEADKFLSFLKSALSVAGKASSTVSTLTSLTSSYEGMQLGFNLEKQ